MLVFVIFLTAARNADERSLICSLQSAEPAHLSCFKAETTAI